MKSSKPNQITRRVFIYENQRYSPISGWSNNLFPTDRKAFSNREGTEGFATADEAGSALLSLGWMLDPDNKSWVVDKVLTDVDADGWSYAVDFSQFSNDEEGVDALTTCGGNPDKGALHFVRRRKLWRFQLFDVNLIHDTSKFTCGHCDLQEIERLSNMFLRAATQLSIHKHPRSLTETKMNTIKEELLSFLSLLQEQTRTPSLEFVVVESYNYETTALLLDKHISSNITAFGRMSSMLQSDTTLDENFKNRLQVIDHLFFTHSERSEIAKLLIRKYDTPFNFHCNRKECGETCIFSTESCQNSGCIACFSRKWAQAHDEICPEKLIPCTQTCGQTVCRKNLKGHLKNECILRSATCPYQGIGCQAELVFKELETHINSEVPRHLEFMFARIIEQQAVITSLHSRVSDLEHLSKYQKEEIVLLKSGLEEAKSALRASEAKAGKELRDKVNKLDSNIARSASALSAEIEQVRRVVEDKSRRAAEQKPRQPQI